MRRLTIMLVAAVVSGCSATATLFPIQGPMSKLSPLPILKARADGITGNTGNISLTMPDGELCKGRWSSIAPMAYRASTASAAVTTVGDMASVWSAVYGSGFSMANVPGVNRGEAVLVGDRGTIIQVEFYTGSGTANGTGVAKDNKGNIYKMLF